MRAERIDRMTDLIGNRRYCFVIMPYGSLGLLYEHLRQVIQGATGLRCIRADEVPGPGQPLLGKVHELISGAELVIAELSEGRPNVYYELGYASAMGKKVLVICKEGTEIPTDLEGMERMEYTDTPLKLPQFDEQFRRHLTILIDSDIQLLRAMLIAPIASPSYIMCSPRWRTAGSKEIQQLERRTYGDYLGVQGILYALGTLLGEERLPELLSAQHTDRQLLHDDCNLYLIGSPRSNGLVGEAMENLQQGFDTPWRFESDETKNITTLIGYWHRRVQQHEAEHGPKAPEEDFGLVLRGPHPEHPKRQILVLAGTRSLGTGAACLAATRPRFIQEIRNLLPKIDLEDKTRTIWALVSGKPDPKDGHVSEEYVSIEDVGVIK